MIVSWLTTNRCNLKCAHCYQDAGGKITDELSTGEAKVLIDQIAKAGFKIMIFSGGEPLLREDILELTAYAKAQNLRPVFGSNGTLITEELALALKKNGAAAMGISLDSLQEEKHNAFRGLKNAFQLTVQGMEHCKNVGLPFQVHTTVMDWNQDEILSITDFAAAIGAAAHYLFFLIPVGRGKVIEATALEVTAYEALLTNIMGYQAQTSIEIKPTCAPQFTRVAEQNGIPTRFSRGCLAGLSYCIINPSGTVRPCAYMTETAGNIRQKAFDRIWTESPLFLRLRTQQYGGVCKQCGFVNICGGCRARAAYYNKGDVMAEDPYCAYGAGLKQEYLP